MTTKETHAGFSLLEIVFSVAVFALFTTSAVGIVIQGIKLNRQSAEQTVATQFASEGIEALRSLKNRSFTNLVGTTASGIARDGSGYWILSGTANTLTHNTSDNYIRVLKIESVNRDNTAPNGNIVASGGTTDSNTKKVTSTVTWRYEPTKLDTVELTSYLTNWKAKLNSGILVYGDGTTTPKYRDYIYASNGYNSETSTLATVAPLNTIVKTSPTKTEAIIGVSDSSGTLQIMCYDGTSWNSEWSVSVGGTGTTRRFDIAYETTSGDVLVAYSRNTGTPNEIGYRTKAGSTGCGSANWSAEVNYDAVRTSGVVHWVRMEGSTASSSDRIGMAWADANSDLSAAGWTGSSWAIAEPAAVLETELERVAASQDSQSFDIAFEGSSDNIMVAWGLNRATTCTANTIIAATNCIRYSRYTTAWGAVSVIPTVADPATNIDMASNGFSNAIVLASLDDNQADLSAAYWSGTAWTGRANLDTSTQAAAAGTMRVATGWLRAGATTRSIIVYQDSGTTNVGSANGNAGTFNVNSDFAASPAFATPQNWYQVESDPFNQSSLMLIVADNLNDLYAKRLVMTSTPAYTWTNADGAAVLENGLGGSTAGPFGFAYWRKL